MPKRPTGSGLLTVECVALADTPRETVTMSSVASPSEPRAPSTMLLIEPLAKSSSPIGVTVYAPNSNGVSSRRPAPKYVSRRRDASPVPTQMRAQPSMLQPSVTITPTASERRR